MNEGVRVLLVLGVIWGVVLVAFAFLVGYVWVRNRIARWHRQRAVDRLIADVQRHGRVRL